MLRLADWFNAPNYERALARFDEESRCLNWPVSERVELYNWAHAAFDATQPQADQLASFGRIYDRLRRYWQVFRPAAGGYLGVPDLHARLVGRCAACGPASGLSLAALDDAAAAAVRSALRALHDVKDMAVYPHMAASKFLHFYNPALFPIYDGAMIGKRVCNGVFRPDFACFCERICERPNDTSAEFLVTYMRWAGECVSGADESFAGYFGDWFRAASSQLPDPHNVLAHAEQCWGTAFEVVALGAALSV